VVGRPEGHRWGQLRQSSPLRMAISRSISM
jgi:hypothetical protein